MNKFIPKYLVQNFSDVKLDIDMDNSFKLSGVIKCECGSNDCLPLESKEILTPEMKAYQVEYKKIIDELISKAPHGYNSYTIRQDKGKHIIGYGGSVDKFIPFRDITELEKKIKNFPLIPLIIVAKCAKCRKEILVLDSSKHGYDALIEEDKEKYSDSYKMKQKGACRKCKSQAYKVMVKISHTGKEHVMSEDDPDITEENWAEAFDWITINLECSGCGKVTKDWIDLETM